MFNFLLELYWPFVFFLFGSLLGSFGNVVIARWPKGESLVRPRSHCPQCKKTLTWYELVPILSWIFLRGRCLGCRAKISARYPLVEALTGALFVSVYLQYGLTWTALELCLLSFGLVTVSFIDHDHYLLPDLFTLSGIVIGLVGAVFNPERDFLSAMGGVLLGGGFLWSIAYLYFVFRKQEGMGGGDIKLLAWIGAVLGWKAIPFVILVSSLVGSVAGLLSGFKSSEGMKKVIPFGPFLAIAAVLYYLGGQGLAHTYLGLFLPFVE